MNIRRHLTPKKIGIGLVAGSVLFVAFWLGVSNLVVYDLSRPKPATIPARADLGGFPVEAVTLDTSDGIKVAGWHVKAPGKNAVILLHGIAANRLQNVSKAEVYAKLGYSVLLYDARAHGESQPVVVTGGWTERFDLDAAMAYMRKQGYERIGLDGFSMGAATIAYAVKHGMQADFVVLESCYRDVTTLIQNAVQWGGLPAFFAAPTLWRIGQRMGIEIADMSPMNCMAKITMPTLILHGDNEFQIHEDQAKEMLAAGGATIKRLHMFVNAGHEVFDMTQPDIYAAQLGAFLEEVGKGWSSAG